MPTSRSDTRAGRPPPARPRLPPRARRSGRRREPGSGALPVRAHGRELGHVLLAVPPPAFGVDVPAEGEHAAVALADRLGLALLRYRRPPARAAIHPRYGHLENSRLAVEIPLTTSTRARSR